MATFNLFSKRQKKLRGEMPDVFTYDSIPNALRIQIVHILKDAIGVKRYSYDTHIDEAYTFFQQTLCREYGVFILGNNHHATPEQQVLDHLLHSPETDKVIDVVELTFRYVDRIVRARLNQYNQNSKLNPDEAIEELNERFKEHGIGYSFDGGEIVRIDSTFIHTEITRPAIALLWNQKFIGANEEYLKAHEHYRHGRNKECLSECLKAFESTMKVICTERSWQFNQTDTAKKLIQVCFQNGLVPTFTQNQFTSLQNLLESGIPTIRNKLGGHGQGQTLQKVDDGMTRYGLNLTGANIIFLVEQSGVT